MLNKIVIALFIAALGAAGGFVVGQQLGLKRGAEAVEAKFKARSIGELRTELKGREEVEIGKYIKGQAGIQKINEGGYFRANYVQYLVGTLSNSAVLASAKDVKLNVDYFSKTGSKIASQQFTIYEFVEPGATIEFKEKVSLPDNVEKFEFQIVEVMHN